LVLQLLKLIVPPANDAQMNRKQWQDDSARGKLKFLEKDLCHCHQGTTIFRNNNNDDKNSNNPPKLHRPSDSK